MTTYTKIYGHKGGCLHLYQEGEVLPLRFSSWGIFNETVETKCAYRT